MLGSSRCLLASAKRLGFLLLIGLVSIALACPVQPAVAQTIPSRTISLRVQTPVYELDFKRRAGAGRRGQRSPGRAGAARVEHCRRAAAQWELEYRFPNSRCVISWTRRLTSRPCQCPTWPHPVHMAGPGRPNCPAPCRRSIALTPRSIAADAFYPDSIVVPGAVQWQQGRRLLALRVFPFSYNPVTRRLMYHPDVQITIQVTPGETSGDLRPGVVAGASNPAAMTTGTLRIRTGARGLYRLTYDNLQTANVPLASTDVATFAMSYLGQPVAVEVTGDGDNRFEPGELVIFYAEPYQGRYQTSNVYWFTYGGSDGLRIDSRSVITGTQPLTTTITQTLHVEVNAEYRSDYPRPQDTDHWFDTPLSPDILTGSPTVTRTYDLALDDALATGTVQVRCGAARRRRSAGQPRQIHRHSAE